MKLSFIFCDFQIVISLQVFLDAKVPADIDNKKIFAYFGLKMLNKKYDFQSVEVQNTQKYSSALNHFYNFLFIFHQTSKSESY